MLHGGDIYSNEVDMDFSVSLNPTVLNDKERELIETAIERGIKEACNYPDPAQADVRRYIADQEGVRSENILAGAGASQLIMAVTQMVRPKRALIIEPGYSGYLHAISSVPGCEVIRYVTKEEEGFYPDERILEYITDDIDILYLQDPINPTGRNLDNTLLSKILDKVAMCYITVLYDMSFFKLSDKYEAVGQRGRTGPSCRPSELIGKYEKLFITGSYTKDLGLPGIRMGYVMSTGDNISKLKCFLPEWNLSSLSSSVMRACAHIESKRDYLQRSAAFIRGEREFLVRSLADMGFKVLCSDTVFIMFGDVHGYDLYDALLKRRILIRKFDDTPPGENYYRIGIKGHEENALLIKAIGEIINGN